MNENQKLYQKYYNWIISQDEYLSIFRAKNQWPEKKEDKVN